VQKQLHKGMKVDYSCIQGVPNFQCLPEKGLANMLDLVIVGHAT